MVVCVINIDDVSVLEPEDDPPIRRNRYGVVTLQRPRQGMQSESWNVHVPRRPALIKHSKDAGQLSGMVRGNSLGSVSVVERIEPPMPERQYHAYRLRRRLSLVNRQTCKYRITFPANVKGEPEAVCTCLDSSYRGLAVASRISRKAVEPNRKGTVESMSIHTRDSVVVGFDHSIPNQFQSNASKSAPEK